MHRCGIAFVLACLFAVSNTAKAEETVIYVPDCLVSLLEEAKVPAPAGGILKSLPVREGQFVAKDQTLAKLDDTRPRHLHTVAQQQLRLTQTQAASDIGVRLAIAAERVAGAEHAAAVSVNLRHTNTVPKSEVRRLELAHFESELRIEQAQLNHQLRDIETHVRQAELDAAQWDIDERRITAPLSGSVVRVYRHVGEWVQAGEPLCHVVRLDRLRVEGFVPAGAAQPQDLEGRPVTIQVVGRSGESAELHGSLIFASPIIDASGEYRVWAEIANLQQRGGWLLRPGATVDMQVLPAAHDEVLAAGQADTDASE